MQNKTVITPISGEITVFSFGVFLYNFYNFNPKTPKFLTEPKSRLLFLF